MKWYNKIQNDKKGDRESWIYDGVCLNMGLRPYEYRDAQYILNVVMIFDAFTDQYLVKWKWSYHRDDDAHLSSKFIYVSQVFAWWYNDMA